MKPLPDVPAFVIEFFHRFFKKSPKFFKVLNIITGIATLIAGGIPVVAWLASFFGIIVPPEWLAYSNVAIAKLTGVAYITGQLAVDKAETRKADILPFTVKKQNEAK